MSSDTYPSAASFDADHVESDPDDELLISIERLSEIRLRIEQLSERLTRMGAAPVRLFDTGRRRGSLAIVRLHARGSIVGGWEVVSVLHHQGSSTHVEPCVPIDERQVERLSGARALCEACRTVRPRKETFIVRERATGRTVQLGSSCLRLLLGKESAEEAIRPAQTFAAIRIVLASVAHQLPAPGEQYIDTIAFLAHAATVVRNNGFRRGCEEDATWRTALRVLEHGVEPANEDLTRAREIRNWASQLGRRDDDEYWARLSNCVQRDRLTSRELPLVASAVRAYNRQLYWQIRRERASDARRK